MPTFEAVQQDVRARIGRIQRIMRANDVDALVLAGRGAPGAFGAVRYVTNINTWAGTCSAVLGVDDPNPWIQTQSSYQAVWMRQETTGDRARVESSWAPWKFTGERARQYAERNRRIGGVSLEGSLTVAEFNRLRGELEGYDIVDLTEPFNDLRQIKTPVEIEAFREQGEILNASLDVFREAARVGTRYWDACAAAEEFVKGKGCFWGRTKMSLDQTPYTVPTPLDRRVRPDDVINFEIVYESPWGYWLEMNAVYSVGPLPEGPRRVLDAYAAAIESSAKLARPGVTWREISANNDRVIGEFGFKVIGKHTPDGHSTGLDEMDGPNSIVGPDHVIRENVVLSFHPGTVLEGNRGFLISDNFLVTPGGAVRLSPRMAERYHLQLEG
jgi:Xaa-Pro aminopeptidase